MQLEIKDQKIEELSEYLKLAQNKLQSSSSKHASIKASSFTRKCSVVMSLLQSYSDDKQKTIDQMKEVIDNLRRDVCNLEKEIIQLREKK
ncbi:hypothetical protein AB837_00404 [bacterium AB1]|nr:hypothetical protein AB837_00404 [bacterium AB1]